MRYQELIYLQTDVSGIRNKDILNVNMSSDFCSFDAPMFSVSGASKINCASASTSNYLVSSATTIPISFIFTGNLETFTATNATFKFEIYKFNKNAGFFTQPSVYKSDKYEYSSFSGTNEIYKEIPVKDLKLDGDYLIKGFYEFDVCTDFLKNLGKVVDTTVFLTGYEYGIYNKNLDFYFTAFSSADKPFLLTNSSTTPSSGSLFQQVILPDRDQTQIAITGAYNGDFILTLNGLVLSPPYDYTFTGNVITLAQPTVSGDIISIIYTTSNNNVLNSDYYNVSAPIISGSSGSEGSNNIFFNTTHSKYEVYMSIEPINGNNLIVMLNGVTLSNGLDYYQSISNNKRIILNGDLSFGDIVTVVYFPTTSTINGIFTPNPYVTWMINKPPQSNNGIFTLELSQDVNFSSLVSSSSQNYVIGQTIYSDLLTLSGSVGTTLYYRVKNDKIFENLCGETIIDSVYSDTIPIIIQTNAINSY